MSMAMMVAMASRKRDDRGRYMDGDNDRRMDGNYSRMDDEPEMRRRRDSRGRYMEDDGGNRMAYEGNRGRMEHDENDMHYRPWPEPHIPPYLDRPDMRDERRMEVPVHMRDRNVVHIRDYQDKRRIGFGENRMMDDEYEGKQHHEYGHSDYKHDKMNQHTAERWVDDMEGSDPAHPMGGKWTPEQVKPYAQKYGFPTDGDKFWEFYAIMNAMYSDNFETAKEFNLVKPEFFASLAKSWLNDKDAVPNKAWMYYECIVK